MCSSDLRAGPSSNELRRFSINLRPLTPCSFVVRVPPIPDPETRAPCLEGSSDRPAHTLATYANGTPEAGRVRAPRLAPSRGACSGKRARENAFGANQTGVLQKRKFLRALEASTVPRARGSMPAATAVVSGAMSTKQVRHANVRSPLPIPPTASRRRSAPTSFTLTTESPSNQLPTPNRRPRGCSWSEARTCRGERRGRCSRTPRSTV